MKLFGRKTARASQSRRLEVEASGPLRSESHRLTLDLDRAGSFSAMLANSRASQVIEVADLLAGMYICNWERLSVYWEDDDREEIEILLRGICRISPQRWQSWIEFYDNSRRNGEPWQIWRPLAKLKKTRPEKSPLRPSDALAAVVQVAEEIAPSRDSVGGHNIPILTSECVLLCIVRSPGSELGKKLAGEGFDSVRLERDALFPRHAPLK